MTTETVTRLVLDPTNADRLASRRGGRSSAVPGEVLAPPSLPRSSSGGSDVDAVPAARLDKLAAGRGGRAHVPPTARTTTPTKKRRHPAKHSRTAALTLSVLASGGLGFLFATTDPGAIAAPAVPVGVVPAAVSATAATPASATPETATIPDAATAAAATATTANAGGTSAPAPVVTVPADPITVNGQSFNNKWGDVQVQATFAADGTLTAVDAVQVPFRDGKSVRINDRAVPQLNSAALSAQSASIDTVSGATYTSIGYQDSLQSAIDIAVANGVPAAASA